MSMLETFTDQFGTFFCFVAIWIDPLFQIFGHSISPEICCNI